MQARIKEMKQANHNKIVHLMISDIHFIWVKDGIHCLHQAIIIGLHDASWRTKLESNDYPLLQHSKNEAWRSLLLVQTELDHLGK